MRRGGVTRISQSPSIVGALTVLVVMVAVFLAYNANNGLPFVPTYRLTVLLPDANTLVRGNEVRIGGVRVGRVASVTATRLPDGTPVAEAELDLNKQVEPLPTDSTVLVRPRSAVALKYLEITPGESPDGFAEDETVPLVNAQPTPVELDQVINTFDEATRDAIQANLVGFGDVLAGRGVSINELFGSLARLVDSAQPAAHNLARRRTNLAGFWRGLAQLAAEVAPVAEDQALLFVDLDRTFAAFAEVARPYIQDTITSSAPAEEAALAAFPVMRPFFEHSAQFFRAFEPGAEALAKTSPVIARAFEIGIPVLNDTPALNEQLPPTAEALLAFQEAGGVRGGLNLLIETNRILDPTLAFLAPAQTTCNYLSLLFRNAASIGSLGDGLGTWTRFITFTPPPGPNNEGSAASAPADGGPNPLNFLHYNPYPNTAAPGQPLECEAGNEVYDLGHQEIGNDPGTQSTITGGQTDSQLRRGGNK